MVHVAVSSPSFVRSSLLMSELKKLPITYHCNESQGTLSEEDLITFLCSQPTEILIIGREPLSHRVLKACPSLRLVCKYGVGLDNLDQEAMQEAGVALGWTPGVNRRGVSELVLSLALGHFRNVLRSTQSMQAGLWVKDGGRQFSDICVGIVGFGCVGSDLSQLIQAFGAKVLVCDILDRSLAAQSVGAQQVSYHELLQGSDMISFHVPSNSSTELMYTKKEIAVTKPGAFIVNTSRGNVVQFLDVCQAVRQKRLGGFAADVFVEEPFDASAWPIHEGFYFTPHIGGNARESVEAMGRSALQHLVQYISSTP